MSVFRRKFREHFRNLATFDQNANMDMGCHHDGVSETNCINEMVKDKIFLKQNRKEKIRIISSFVY